MGRELVVERPAMTYWLGYAHAKGIDCRFAAPSTLGHHPHIYGAEYEKEARFAAQVTEGVLPPSSINPQGNLNTTAQVEAFMTTVATASKSVSSPASAWASFSRPPRSLRIGFRSAHESHEPDESPQTLVVIKNWFKELTRLVPTE